MLKRSVGGGTGNQDVWGGTCAGGRGGPIAPATGGGGGSLIGGAGCGGYIA